MSVVPTPTEDAHPRHPVNRHRLEKFEGAADIMVVVGIVILGLAMVIGLVTASGSIHL